MATILDLHADWSGFKKNCAASKKTEQTMTNLLLAGHVDAATNFMDTQLATLSNARAGSAAFRLLAYTEMI